MQKSSRFATGVYERAPTPWVLETAAPMTRCCSVKMPELIEQMYCSRQIVIPPKFPYILKRYAKASIKTQPYDLLRWSFEYFKALAENRTPPVKLRLEYPVFNTDGGLTKGYLKVLACQLEGLFEVPHTLLKTVWNGSCLDLTEMKRILCMCDAYNERSVKRLHFIAVAGGLLTKSLTHTMILLCETLSKEPEGGSAAIPLEDFLMMYKFLAHMDASRDVKFIDGYREGVAKKVKDEEEEENQEEEEESVSESAESNEPDDFWQDAHNLQHLALIDDQFDRSTRLSIRMTMPVIGPISRSPSIERAGQIDRDNFLRGRKARPGTSESVDKQLVQMGNAAAGEEVKKEASGEKEKNVAPPQKVIKIVVTDEEGEELPWKIDGEPDDEMQGQEVGAGVRPLGLNTAAPVSQGNFDVTAIVENYHHNRNERIKDLEQTFAEIADIVDKFKSSNYDLGMVAGRQMSTTSGEFIVQHIERDIMAVIDEQIDVLPDPNLKKKKAKPEEVAMIRVMLDQFLAKNIHLIVQEEEEIEEEEVPIPDIITVYAVPGIGPPVERQMIMEVESYAREVARTQGDLIMPRNIRHFLCPPLEQYLEMDYESYKAKEEEVPTGGVITE